MYYKLPIVHQPTQKFFASWVEGGQVLFDRLDGPPESATAHNTYK